MKNSLKTKDILLISLLTTLYVVLYFVVMMVIVPLGAFGHAISPGLIGLLGGTIIYFMIKKVGKMWQLTLLTLLVMGFFSLIGGGYLPWLISSVSMSVIADLLVSRKKDSSVFKIAIASGLLHVGQAWGAIIPSIFFVEKYKEEWIKRGQTVKDMDEMIKYTAGQWGLISTVVVFLLAFIGIYIGYTILKKHLKEA